MTDYSYHGLPSTRPSWKSDSLEAPDRSPEYIYPIYLPPPFAYHISSSSSNPVTPRPSASSPPSYLLMPTVLSDSGQHVEHHRQNHIRSD